MADTFEAESSPSAGGEELPAEAKKSGVVSIQLSHNGVVLGYLNKDGHGWAVLSDEALPLEMYIYGDVTYYRIAADTSSYLSVGNAPARKGYVGFYGWSGASSFTLKNDHLVSDYNGQQMSFYSKDDGYIYCWDDYTVVEVKLV